MVEKPSLFFYFVFIQGCVAKCVAFLIWRCKCITPKLNVTREYWLLLVFENSILGWSTNLVYFDVNFWTGDLYDDTSVWLKCTVNGFFVIDTNSMCLIDANVELGVRYLQW